MATAPHHSLSDSVGTSDYDRGLVCWAIENAALLRAGKLDGIDAAHIAEELEDLGAFGDRISVGSLPGGLPLPS